MQTSPARLAAALAGALVLSLQAGCGGGGGGGGGGGLPLVGRASVANGLVQADAGSDGAAISSDGQWVAFASTATNLVAPGDPGAARDVFLHDRINRITTKLSVPTGAADEANGDSLHPSLSAGAQFIAFESQASDLVGGPGNAFRDVFVRNRALGETTLASRDTLGGVANGDSRAPSISSDGRYVAYESLATDLVDVDSNPAGADIFLFDRLQAGPALATVLISRASDDIQGNPGPQPSSGNSRNPAISATGAVVAYESDAQTLVSPSDAGTFRDIFIRDRGTRVTERASFRTRASQQDPKLEPDGDSFSPSISSTGAFVAFASDATNLVAADSNGAADVFLFNRIAQTITRVSVASTGTQSVGGDSHSPSISQDGRFVAFVSEATNLVVGDTNGRADVFIHDTVTGATRRASRTSAGNQLNEDAEGPVLSSGAGVLAYSSEADNVVEGDTNDASDVFVHVGPLNP